MKAIEIIKKARKSKKISQNFMAQQLHIARSTYQAIETGTNNMNINDFFKIIEILEIPITYFSNTDLIVIEKEDLNKLEEYSYKINTIIQKIKYEEKTFIDTSQENTITQNDQVVINNYGEIKYK